MLEEVPAKEVLVKIPIGPDQEAAIIIPTVRRREHIQRPVVRLLPDHILLQAGHLHHPGQAAAVAEAAEDLPAEGDKLK